MASAAISAPPMASSIFQSASKAFNEQTPQSQMRGIAHVARKITPTQCGGRTPASADAH
jgi:hypothetical protein